MSQTQTLNPKAQQDLDQAKLWNNQARNLLGMAEKKLMGKRMKAVHKDLDLLLQVDRGAAKGQRERYQAIANKIEGIRADPNLTPKEKKTAIAKMSQRLEILTHNIRVEMGTLLITQGKRNGDQDQVKRGEKLVQKGTEKLFDNKVSTAAKEHKQKVKDWKELEKGLKTAIKQGNPNAIKNSVKQLQETFAHPSSYPYPDDQDDAELTPKQAEKRKVLRKKMLQDRKEHLETSLKLLNDTLANIPNGQEKNELLALKQKLEMDIKFAMVETNDPYRAALYQDKVRTEILKVEQSFAGVVPPEYQEALLTRLATKLSSVVDELTSAAVFNHLGDELGSYSEKMESLLANNNGDALFQQFPGLRDMIKLEAEQFAENVSEVFEQARDDMGELAGRMFKGANITGLKDMIVADSDPHNGGRRVTILKFVDNAGKEYKVVNKPRDVRVDAKFVGSTGKTDQAAGIMQTLQQNITTRKQREQQLRQTIKQGNNMIGDQVIADLVKNRDQTGIDLLLRDPEKQQALQELQQIRQLDGQITHAQQNMPSMSELATGLMRASAEKEKQRLKNIRATLRQERGDNLSDDDLDQLAKRVTVGLRQNLAEMTGAELAQLVNDGGRKGTLTGLDKTTFQPVVIDDDIKDEVAQSIKELPTYQFIDKPGKTDQDHRYGWVEFVEHGRPEDCVLDKKQAEEFYQQVGQLTALSWIFGIEDVHQGNIMVREGQPVLTDLEIAFSSKSFSSLGTLNTPQDKQKFVKEKLDLTMFDMGIGKGSQQHFLGDKKVEGDFITQRELTPEGAKDSTFIPEATENMVLVKQDNGEVLSHVEGAPKDFKDSMQGGMKQLMETMGDSSLTDAMDTFVDSFKGVHVRYHALATMGQLEMRRGAMTSGYGTLPTEQQKMKGKVETALDGKIRDNPKLQSCVQVMTDDLCKRDVAYFTQELGSKKVLHNGKNPLSHQGDEDILETDGLEVAKQQLAILRDPVMRQMLETESGNFFNKAIQSTGPSNLLKCNKEVKSDLGV